MAERSRALFSGPFGGSAMRNLKAWDVWAVFAIAVVAVILAVVFNQSPLLVFTLVAFALCAYMAIRLSVNDYY